MKEPEEITLKDFIHKFLFDTPLYTALEVTDDFLTMFVDSNYWTSLEGYNPLQKQESTFSLEDLNLTDLRGIKLIDISVAHRSKIRDLVSSGGYINIQLKCKRTEDVFFYYMRWDCKSKKITKIGQYPSLADFHTSELKKYKKVLSNGNRKDFARAIGLAANGIGIGSFAYLRRIFEELIHNAYEVASTDQNFDVDSYKKTRMSEKIEILSDYLPDILVEHKQIYSILSKGIHELDEQTCLANFAMLRESIELILDEKVDELNKNKKLEKITKAISDCATKIK